MSSLNKYQDTNPVVRRLLARFFTRLGAVLGEAAPATVLDAGCGEGELARRGVIPPGASAVFLDLQAGPLAYFQATSKESRLVRGSVLALPFGDASFDAVVCLEVLEHLADPAAALAELGRVARRRVILSVPHEPYFRLGNRLRGKYRATGGNHPGHIQHWNCRSFGALLAAQFGEVRLVEAFPWIIAGCASCRRVSGGCGSGSWPASRACHGGEPAR